METVYCNDIECVGKMNAEENWVENLDHGMSEFAMRCPVCGKVNVIEPEPSVTFTSTIILDWEGFFGITIEEVKADEGLLRRMSLSMYQSFDERKPEAGILDDEGAGYGIILDYQAHADMELDILYYEED